MIDPAFEKRLENWGRAIRAGSMMLAASPTYQAMLALRLKYGPDEDSWEPSSSPTVRTNIDDADLLTRAWRSNRLSQRDREILRLRYGEGASDGRLSRRFRVSASFMADYRETIIRKFQRVVEELDEREAESGKMTPNSIPTA